MCDFHSFLEQLSSADPVPGGGSVAALQTAMAASLVAMVAHLTIGRKRYEAVQEQVSSILARAIAFRDDAHALIDEDVQAYRGVSTVLALPRATEEERAHRQRQLQEALKGAVAPPLRTMRVASGVAYLAAELVSIGNRSAVSDLGTAAIGARAGYHAARLNVEINLQSIHDADWCAAVRSEMLEAPAPDAVEAEVLERATGIIRGEAE